MEKSLEECYFEIYTRILQGLCANPKLKAEEIDDSPTYNLTIDDNDIIVMAKEQAEESFYDLFGRNPITCGFDKITFDD